jgi:hypothetical protein
MLEQGHRLLVEDLDGLDDDEQLDLPMWTNWRERWPAWRIFWTMIQHDFHHGQRSRCAVISGSMSIAGD